LRDIRLIERHQSKTQGADAIALSIDIAAPQTATVRASACQPLTAT
jgi:hypothetical protein